MFVFVTWGREEKRTIILSKKCSMRCPKKDFCLTSYYEVITGISVQLTSI